MHQTSDDIRNNHCNSGKDEPKKRGKINQKRKPSEKKKIIQEEPKRKGTCEWRTNRRLNDVLIKGDRPSHRVQKEGQIFKISLVGVQIDLL